MINLEAKLVFIDWTPRKDSKNKQTEGSITSTPKPFEEFCFDLFQWGRSCCINHRMDLFQGNHCWTVTFCKQFEGIPIIQKTVSLQFGFEHQIKFSVGCKAGLVGSDINGIDDDLNHVFRFCRIWTEDTTNPDRGPHFLEHGQARFPPMLRPPAFALPPEQGWRHRECR